jgi:hypothetical protein
LHSPSIPVFTKYSCEIVHKSVLPTLAVRNCKAIISENSRT